MIAKSLKPFSFVAMSIALSGCSTQVTLQNPTIPDPLIETLPLAVAVRYPEAFQHYVHKEKVIGKDEWTIDMGRANSMLFTQLFGAMFADCTVIGEPPTPSDEDEEGPDKPIRCNFVAPGTDPGTLPIDALIEPSIDAFEFSVPEQSQTDSFAVWIRYRLKIFDADGNEIANWPLSAYGKSMDSFMGSDEALRRAAVLAMRDAAALVILQMDKSANISALVASRRARPASTTGGVIEALPVNKALTTATEERQDDSG
ncbi:MAG TPA: hypothetical protein VFG91_06685 [Woeseiaceae bacterium]|nr:hypothetical protein [Woeseiaceae bacterium]